jgi:DNA-binding protein WhiA
MSFSSEVKDELSMQISSGRHCQIAEIAAIISLCGKVLISKDDRYSLKIHTENIGVARKYFTLVKKTFNIKAEISIRQNLYFKKNRVYTVMLKRHEEAIKVLQAAKLLNRHLEIEENLSLVNNLVIQNTCCKRAFLRGAFLACGSISDPEKFYHFEIVCATEHKAKQLQEVIQCFDLDAKITSRKNHYIVYLKEAAGIVDVLNVMEAHVALMNLENVRILKDMRNSVNRQVNCETANINKTVNAAVKQIEDIKFIKRVMGLDNLSEGLQEIAHIRLEYPEAPLKELGTFLTPQVGKSGVNHRLRKLSNLAEELRNSKEETL